VSRFCGIVASLFVALSLAIINAKFAGFVPFFSVFKKWSACVLFGLLIGQWWGDSMLLSIYN